MKRAKTRSDQWEKNNRKSRLGIMESGRLIESLSLVDELERAAEEEPSDG